MLPSLVHASGLTSPWWNGAPSVTQDYGCTPETLEPLASDVGRSCPSTKSHWHTGVDVGLGCTEPLSAPIPLHVVSIGGEMSTWYGNHYPTLRTSDGHDILLGHVQQTYVTAGQDIAPNTPIAAVGSESNAGTSTGCHLHFEVRPAGGAYKSDINPWPFFDPNSVGGLWVTPPTPNDGTSALNNYLSLPVKAHVDDHTGTGLSRVDFSWSAEGSNQWSKSSTWFPISGSDVSFNIPMPSGGWPTKLIISFDVYANNGKANPAPNGMRRICRSDVAACPKVTDVYPGNIGGSGQPSNTCTPGSNQIAAFVDPNFSGACIVKDIGSYNDPASIGLPNDSISSIKVGAGAKVMLCRDNNLSNTCEWLQSDDSDLSNNSVGTDQVSSMQVTGGAPTTGCVPGDLQIALFVDENYGGTCIVKEFGTYNDPGTIDLPNDSISSIKVGARAKAELCRDNGLSNTCEWFDYNDDHLSNNSVGDNQVSSVQVISRGNVALCDNTNYGGECHWYSAGDTGESHYNMADQGFDNRTESVYYDPNYAGLYHTVLYTDPNQSGALYHADNSVSDLSSPYDNNISSIKIYKNQPPASTNLSPTDNAKFSNTTTDVDLSFSGGDSGRVHVWSDSYNFNGDWQTSHTQHLSGLTPGRYYWQSQASNIIGVGAWTDISSFTINTPPKVVGGAITVPENTSQSVQVAAIDDEQDALTLSASNLPSFATFTDNHDGTATVSINPQPGNAGSYTINIQANDGSLTGSGSLTITVPAGGFTGQYYANQTLSGNPTLTRSDPSVNFEWNDGSPDPSIPLDHFSARWTKTANFAAGTYAFSATADDGVRLYVDGQPIIDKWIDQGATTYTATQNLSAGNHTIVMEYYENDGGAVAKLNYYLFDDGSGDYQASYWDNQNLSGTPVLTRDESAINNVWNDGSPDPSVPVDHFSARWTKVANLAAGTYQFTATGDDGLRLYIDDQPVIDKWIDQGSTTYTATKTLAAGNHNIRFEYYENDGGAVAKFSYSQIPQNDYQGQYWNNQTLSGSPTLTRSDPSVNFEWNDGSPDPSISLDHFSARWTKTENFTAGTYTFSVTADDGVRLYIDNQLVIDKWIDQGATTYTTDQTLTAGAHTIRMDYYENGGGAIAKLSYQPAAAGTELLSSPWHLTGTEGQEAYQSISPTALQGKTTMRITYNLHGLQALGNDASAIVIDQGGNWHYVSLSNYGQNGLDGNQTVNIPLSDFPLDLSSPIDGSIHTRFWNSTQYTVDISSIQLL